MRCPDPSTTRPKPEPLRGLVRLLARLAAAEVLTDAPRPTAEPVRKIGPSRDLHLCRPGDHA